MNIYLDLRNWLIESSRPKLKISSDVSAVLDFFRGAAAVVVVLSHLRALFFVDYAEIYDPNILAKCFYFVTGFGHQGVIVFFVLSGFFIGKSVIEKNDELRWEWRDYLVSRLSRLYIVLFPALLLGLGWDLFGISMFGDSVYTGHSSNRYILDFNIQDRLGAYVWICNALFLQEIVSPPFGSNGPLWSLSYEFWYYIIFPAIVVALSFAQPLKCRLLHGSLAVFLVFIIGEDLALYFLIWLMGAFVFLLPRPDIATGKTFRAFALVASTVSFFCAIVFSRVYVGDFSPYGIDVAAGITFCIWLYAIIHLLPPIPSQVFTPFQAFSGLLSGFSYSLYLVHMPILVFFQAWLIGDTGKWQFDLRSGVCAIVIFATALVYAHLVSLFTERRTGQLRQFILVRLDKFTLRQAD